MSDWLPIKTVPKDETVVDLWCRNISDGRAARFPAMWWNGENWEDWHGYVLEQKWHPVFWMHEPDGPEDTSPVSLWRPVDQ